jgi:hypothetical protein
VDDGKVLHKLQGQNQKGERSRTTLKLQKKWIFTSSQKKKPRKRLSFSSGVVLALSLDAKSAGNHKQNMY